MCVVLKQVGEVIGADVAKICHRADCPGFHVSSIQVENQTVHGKVVVGRTEVVISRACNQHEESLEITVDKI